MSQLVLSIVDRKGHSHGQVELPFSATLRDLKDQMYLQDPKLHPDRQSYTIERDGSKIRLKDDNSPLRQYKLMTDDVLTFKDLGRQISWKTVFLVEYGGPIIIHAMVFFFPNLFYERPLIQYHPIQQAAFGCVTFHYVKRELETEFVHRFSNATMPFKSLFKNCSHYWILSGVCLAYFMYHPEYVVPDFVESNVNICIPLFIITFLMAELGNFKCHITLMRLRRPGTRERGVPRGGMFDYVTCANYTYELLAWLIFCFFTQTLMGWIFFVVSFIQISIWSLAKQKKLKAEFGNKVTARKSLIPFIY